MRHHAPAEEAGRARHRTIDELIDDHEAARLQFFAQRADRGNGQQVGATRPLERIDVRARGNLARRNAVPPAMPRQEAKADLADPSE